MYTFYCGGASSSGYEAQLTSNGCGQTSHKREHAHFSSACTAIARLTSDGDSLVVATETSSVTSKTLRRGSDTGGTLFRSRVGYLPLHLKRLTQQFVLYTSCAVIVRLLKLYYRSIHLFSTRAWKYLAIKWKVQTKCYLNLNWWHQWWSTAHTLVISHVSHKLEAPRGCKVQDFRFV